LEEKCTTKYKVRNFCGQRKKNYPGGLISDNIINAIKCPHAVQHMSEEGIEKKIIPYTFRFQQVEKSN
jgi:hypothetical protein